MDTPVSIVAEVACLISAVAGLAWYLLFRRAARGSEGEWPFQVGDIVEQHCHFDVTHFVPGPDEDKVGARWKVLEITDDYVHLELVEGRYHWGFQGIEYQYPGYASKFRSCDNYRKQYPRRKGNRQIFDEFRKAA